MAVLHAMSSPALGSLFAACNTPCEMALLRPMRITRHDARSKRRVQTDGGSESGPFRSKPPVSRPCSRFLPYVSVQMGLLACARRRLALARASVPNLEHGRRAGLERRAAERLDAVAPARGRLGLAQGDVHDVHFLLGERLELMEGLDNAKRAEKPHRAAAPQLDNQSFLRLYPRPAFASEPDRRMPTAGQGSDTPSCRSLCSPSNG